MARPVGYNCDVSLGGIRAELRICQHNRSRADWIATC